MDTFDKTTILVPEPSFLSGVGHTIDIGGTFATYNRSATPAEADARALAADWAAVADDLQAAIGSVTGDPGE